MTRLSITHGNDATVITADARTTTPAEFLDAVFPGLKAKRERDAKYAAAIDKAQAAGNLTEWARLLLEYNGIKPELDRRNAAGWVR